jgi:hypothetical protein
VRQTFTPGADIAAIELEVRQGPIADNALGLRWLKAAFGLFVISITLPAAALA